MKGQDIIIALRLHSIWQDSMGSPDKELFSVRSMGDMLGISKTEVSRSNQRNLASGLVRQDRKTGLLKPDSKALLEFLTHGIKYVFPVKLAEIVRGVPTAHAAPVLEGKMMSAGDLIPVWPDANSSQMGQAIQPLIESVPAIAKKDSRMYELLALIDAIRMGGPRESELAKKMLAAILVGEK